MALYHADLEKSSIGWNVEELRRQITELVDAAQAFDKAFAFTIDQEMCYLADWLESVEASENLNEYQMESKPS